MSMLSDTVNFSNGEILKNRVMLAPLTNLQSGKDGVLGDDELRWLKMRAEGGFGLTMTCATSVQFEGVGFSGQLGAYHDRHDEGLARLAEALHASNTHAVVQIHHGGRRSASDVIGRPPMCPSNDDESGSVAMTDAEISCTIEDFVSSAERCQRAGFDGIEIHAAHGYLIGQFLSPQFNQRNDAYGGSQDNRERFLMEVIEGISQRCGRNFSLGVRLSPERFGIDTGECLDLASRLLVDSRLDYLDMSLWDIFKGCDHPAIGEQTLLQAFAALPRDGVRLGVAGKLYTAEDCQAAIDAGIDMVAIGRAAILHHDFPKQIMANSQFKTIDLPVTAEYLRRQGVGDGFLGYLSSAWDNFVAK